MDLDPRQARITVLLFLLILTSGQLKLYLTRSIYPDPAVFLEKWPPQGCLVDASALKDRALEEFPAGTTVDDAIRRLERKPDILGSQ